MNKKNILFAMLGLLCSLQHAFSQNLSNKGREFWVGYGHHQFMEPGQPNSQEMVLYLSAEQAANVTVTIDGTAYVRNYVVPANSVIATQYLPKSGATDARLISLPCSFVPPGFPCGGEGVFVNKGIHIVSDVPIVAYAHIFGSASSGASMLMPVETWGYSYVTLNSKQNYAANCFSWAYVIAKHDNTVIEITPTATTRAGRAINVPYTVTLQRGQIYQLMAGPESGSSKPELSGSKIKSIANPLGECYPIAVFAGSSRTRNEPVSCGLATGGDNDNQQCFPSQAWGKRYLLAPTSNSITPSVFMFNTYKIAVKDPLVTQVWRNGTLMTGLISNSYYEFTSNQPEYITSNQPVMVAQFIHSGSACFGGSGVGDPEMMYISPIEQGIKRIGFYRNDEQSIIVNYLTLIIPTAGISSLLIDGSNVFDYSYVHPRLAGYSVVVKRWTGAKAQAIAQSDSAFTAITYGLGSVESYGYNAGTLINNLNAVGSIFNVSDTSSTTVSHPFTCTNTPVQLSVLLGYPTPPTRLVWELSQVGGGLSPNTDIIDNAPVPVGTTVINGLTYYKFQLAGTYTLTTAGTYRVPILATHPTIENCSNTEEVFYLLEVKGKPVSDFSLIGTTPPNTNCILDSVRFNSPTVSSNGFTINQWLWSFPNTPTSATSANPSHLFNSTGPQTINLHIVSAEGCVGDTVKTINIYAKPTTSITAAPLSACEGGTISLSETSTYGGTAPINNYYWNFGNGTASTAGPHTITYPAFGTYTVQHVAGVSTTCVSDTSAQVVRVYAKPTTTFSYPAGCLPASGTVQFTSTAATADGQAITSHTWNFGDPASGAANTSTLANPTHNYPSFGNYTITYSVTTANGCTKDTTVNATFNLSPTFSYPALTPICVTTPGTISVATATVTNGVPGTGVYSGPGTDAAGNFTPSVAGPGLHTITYTYTATSGCTAATTQQINVYPKPTASYTIAPSTGCLPASGQVQFTYNGTAAASYLWSFGDPASGAANSSTLANPVHNFSTSGNYSINLTVTSTNGCTDDTLIVKDFNITPVLSYPAISSVCESVAGTVSVATATVTNGVTGTGVYSGPGTDAAGNFNPATAGPGTHTITYTFTSTGGCVVTATSTVTVGAKPLSSFTFSPNTACIPANGQVQFTYNGTAVTTYNWNFGDPASGALNTSTAASPLHVYATSGSYSISLNVTAANGCTDDSVLTATFNITPVLSYPALPSVCESVAGTVSVATATVTNGVTGTGIYSGSGTDAAGNFNPAIAGPGTHVITYTFTSAGGCVVTATSNVTVGAKPLSSFTFSPNTACIPANGQVQFTYNGTAAASYVWNFGDPASGALNTSTAASPSHIYATSGSYSISLNVTAANGCTDDSVLTATFNITPVLSYPALPSVCESVAGTVSVATATVTNGVTGTGVYSGPGTDAAGNFNPATAGPGTHAITYTFTSAGGCVATATSNVTVGAKPLSSFTFSPNTACIPANGQVQFTYNGTAAASYVWNFGDPASGALNTSTAASPLHVYATSGSYSISLNVTAANGCTDDSVLTSTFNITPVLSYPSIPSVCESVSGTVSVATATVTNGVTGTGVYSGPGTDAAGNFNPATAGPGTHTITYTFTSAGGCVVTATSNVTVGAKPLSSFTFSPNTACIPANGQVQFTYNGTAVTTYNWTFGDPASGALNTSTAASPSHIYTNTGTYNIVLSVTAANGCTDDSIITRTISVTPALNYPALTSVCESTPAFSIASGTVTNNVTGTGIYSGPGTDAAGSFNPSLAGAGTHTITYTFTSTGGCVASVASTITVNPKPLASFTVPAIACLPVSGQVQFTFNGSSTGGQTYLWNFNDPNATTGNPNTATVASPSHNYTNTGSYNVLLTVTGANGCTDDTTITRVFSVTPALTYATLTSVCENVTGSIPVASATVTNGVSGTGVYSGPGTDAAGNFDPSVAGAGTHTITYTFTSTGNCIATITQTIVVNPAPLAQFTATSNICLDKSTLIDDNSSIVSGSIITWNWNLGDNTTASYNNSNNFNHSYTTFGSFPVSLTVISDNGCVSNTATQTVEVHAMPLAKFDLPVSVCMPNGSTAFTNNSSVPDNSSLTYQWDFGDLNNSTATSPSHIYAASGSYDIRLTATSEWGCVDDSVRTFAAFFDKPLSVFIPRPDTVCQGKPITFSSASSAPNSTISSYLWNFGDGNTSQAESPVWTYSHPGNFTVKLVVSSSEGCKSDTAFDNVVVYLQPVIDAGQSFVVPEGTIVQFTAIANSPGLNFTWSPPSGLSDANALTPLLQAQRNETYTLVAMGQGSCMATDFITVKILKPVNVVNAFSPNGDGINDTWIINNLADYPGTEVEVFNRYGQTVFKSNGYSKPWDGTLKGSPLPVATYYYIIDLKNGFKPLNGSITIIR